RDIDPPRMLAMTWPGEDEHESEVVFELFPQGEKVLLVITHRRLAGRGEMANVASGWHAHLGVLATVLKDGRVKRFWSRIPQLEADYQRRLQD
ncbi:MAG: SRPBCC domain-containing protein, partial [Planifilum fulgidum]